MAKMKQDKKMKRVIIKSIIGMDTKSLNLLRRNIDDTGLKSDVMSRQKGFATKISVPKQLISVTYIQVVLT